MTVRLFHVGAITLALALLSCTGQRTALPPVNLATLLPAPSELGRGTSDSEAERTLNGDEYDVILPVSNVAANGSALDFDSGPPELHSWAYSGYTFNIPDFAGQSSVYTVWDNQAVKFWIGVADYASDRWVWEQGLANAETVFDNLLPADMLSPTGQIHVVILVTEEPDASLQSIRVGGVFVAPNQLPVARINVIRRADTAERGDWSWPGHDLYFSFVNSFDPDGQIDHFNVDWDGNGTYDQFLPWNSRTDITHSFAAPGNYTVKLRVTDNSGATATHTTDVTIVGPPYDEVEPNDVPASATVLPALLLDDYQGAVTADAAAVDWYRFDLAAPQWVRLELHMADSPGLGCSPQIELYEADGTTLRQSHYAAVVDYCDTGSYCVKVCDLDNNAHDYELEMCTVDDLNGCNLSCDVTSGDAPLIVHFEALDAAHQVFGAKEVRWDLDNDGTFETGSTNQPIADMTGLDVVFFGDGPYTVRAEVVDYDNAVTTSSLEVDPAADKDIEPNDNAAQAQHWNSYINPLMAHVFLLQEGAVGLSSEGGSTEDWWSLDISSSDVDRSLEFQIENNSGVAELRVEIIAPDGTTVMNELITVNGDGRMTVPIAEAGTHFVRISIATLPSTQTGGYRIFAIIHPDGGSG